jgi:uncharacterized protein YjeT (DUF2065 family)
MLTAFLAAIWGPTLLALGIGFLASPRYYTRLYADLDKQPLALLALSLILIPFGIIQTTFHNAWGTLIEGVVSFLGWATLIKGIMIAVFPKLIDRAAKCEVKYGVLPIAGIFMIALGVYLSWFAFF